MVPELTVMNLEDSLDMFSCKKLDTQTNVELLAAKRINNAALIYDKEKCFVSQKQSAPQEDTQTLPVFFSGKSYTKPTGSKEAKVSSECAGILEENEVLTEISSTSENHLSFVEKEPSSFSSQISNFSDSSLRSTFRTEAEAEETPGETFDVTSQVESDRHSQVQDFVRIIEAQIGNSSGKVQTNKRLKVYDSHGSESPVPSSSNDDGTVTWYSCDKCHLEFNSRKSLANHAKTHPKVMVGKNTCVYCGAKSEDPKDLNSHLLMEHLYDVSNFTCESCQVECISADLFDKHQYSCHRKEDTSSLICPVCDKVYYDNDIFTFHKTQQKQCHICCLTFCMTSLQFKIHKAKHTLFKYECEYCSATFVTKASLTKHLDADNPCGQKYKTKVLEPYDESSADDDETILENVKSEDSGGTKSDGNNLPSSTSAHQAEKAEKCLLCPAEFVHLKNLWKHVAIVHQTAIEVWFFYCLVMITFF